MEIPDHIESCCEQIERQIEDSLELIKEKNEILGGIKLLSRRVKPIRRLSKKRRLRLGKLKQVRRRCEELQQVYDKNDRELRSSTVDDNDENSKKEPRRKLKQEYENTVCDYLQEQMNLTFNMRDEDVSLKELGDVIFYYLRTGTEPHKQIQKIFHRFYEPRCNRRDSWYELCGWVLGFDKTFNQFYKRVYNDKTTLECLLYKRPQLLLNKRSYKLLRRLIEHLPYDNLYKVLTDIRDKNGQTHMFYTVGESELYVTLYRNHTDDLYELLSIRNTNGETALHVNTLFINVILANINTPKQRDALIKLTSITDYNNQTALQVSKKDWLFSLISRVESNEYVVWTKHDTRVLIIYNTKCGDKDRQGAEEEAKTIYNALDSNYIVSNENITLEKNKTEDQIFNLIKQTANQVNQFNDPPKSLVVILASHGNAGLIVDCDGNPIKISDIEEAMCCDIMDGKPKMLITQCCQNREKTVIDDSITYSPTHNDFCAVMSCVADQKSKRGFFLGKLAEEIKHSKKDTNIFKIVNMVSRQMERERRQQIPIIMSTLRAEFCPTDDWILSK